MEFVFLNLGLLEEPLAGDPDKWLSWPSGLEEEPANAAQTQKADSESKEGASAIRHVGRCSVEVTG